MKVMVYCFAVDREKLVASIDAPPDELLARISADMEEEELDEEDRADVAGYVRGLLEGKLQRISSVEELDASGFLLKSVGEEVPLYELGGWKSAAFRHLRLDEIASSSDRPCFNKVSVPPPNCLQYFSAQDISERILPELARRAEEPGPPEWSEEDDDGDWKHVHEELHEILESICDDGLDAILITILD